MKQKFFGYVEDVSDIINGTNKQGEPYKMVTVKINPYDPEKQGPEEKTMYHQETGEPYTQKALLYYKALREECDTVVALQLKKGELVEFIATIKGTFFKGYENNEVKLTELKRYEQPKPTPAFP